MQKAEGRKQKAESKGQVAIACRRSVVSNNLLSIWRRCRRARQPHLRSAFCLLPTAFCLLLSAFCLLANAQARRVVIIKVDGLPYAEVDRYVHERDPRTGQSRLPWIEHIF